MVRAIELARRGLYSTDPNPRVGCVLVRDGVVVGEGYHQRAGEPHAERNALAAAGDAARGATAYVTLEPCCHHGKTPPCTEGLLEAGVSRVVAAMVDPNPLVAGKGLAMLADAGVQTASGLLEQAARALNPGFIKRMAEARPFVRLKLGMSLDGRTAMASGESQWITGPQARADVQRLRARSTAILTGIGTVLADDPSLNVRMSAEQQGLETTQAVRQPLRIVMDSKARMQPSARMLALPGETCLLVGESASPQKIDALIAAGAQVEPVPEQAAGRLQWSVVLQKLVERQCNEVLLECGAKLAGSALQAGVVDELVIYQAPKLLGDAARGLVRFDGVERLADAPGLQLIDQRQIGDDLRLTFRLKS